MRGLEITNALRLPHGGARLLLVRLDNAGDVILLSPTVAALREALPDAELTLLASPAGAEAAAIVPGLDRVITHRASWQQLQAGTVAAEDERSLIEQLRSEGFNAAFIFTSFAQDAIAPAYACYLAGIPVRVAYTSSQFSGEVISLPVPSDGAPRHQAERNLHLLRSVGVPVRESSLQVRIPEDARTEAARLLAAAGIPSGAPFIALAPGASAPARRYEPGRFAALAGGLAAPGLPVVVLGSAREQGLAGEVEAASGSFGVMSFGGRTSLPVMAAVVGRSALVVANNSLAMHLADALRVPAVIAYAGTDPREYWEPRRTTHELLSRSVSCSPCFRIECDRGHECLDINPREVLDAAQQLLTRRASAHQWATADRSMP